MSTNTDVLVTPFFKTIPTPDPKASKAAGRPIFRDDVYVEVRIAGERNYAPVFPAFQMWKRVNGEEVSYAERWPEQFQRFKANQTQVASGTPLSELPFLTEAKRAELKAFKIYTAEALAALEGKNLKTLGIDGRKWKDQAAAYLDSARKGANSNILLDEINTLKERLAKFEGMQVPAEDGTSLPISPADEFTIEGATDDQLKAFIKARTGAAPRGTPSRDTLENMANEAMAMDDSEAA